MQKSESRSVRKQDYLLHLIHSLNTNEKRYFKLFNSLQPGSKKHELLFDELVKAEKYNAADLCKKLNKSTTQLSSEKEYLQKVLLKSLRSFNEKHDEISFNNDMGDITLLLDKEIYESAQLLIKKSMSKAEKRSRYDVVYYLSRQQGKLLNQIYTNYSPGYITEHSKRIEKAKDALLFLQQQLAFDELHVNVSSYKSKRLLDRNPKETAETMQMLRHPLLVEKFTHPLFRLQQYENKAMLYFMLSEFEKATSFTALAIALQEKYPEQTGINTEDYFISIHNYFNSLISTKQLKRAANFISKLQTTDYSKLPLNAIRLNKLLSSYIPTYRAMYYMHLHKGDITPNKEISNFLLEVRKEEPLIKMNLKPGSWDMFIYFIAILHFKLNDKTGAAHWLNKLIQEGNTNVYPHLHCVARVVYAIMHAELGNYMLVPSLVQSARHLLKKHKLGTAVEEAILALLIKLPSLKNKSERKTAFNELNARFRVFEKNPGQLQSLRMFNYRLWVERNL